MAKKIDVRTLLTAELYQNSNGSTLMQFVPFAHQTLYHHERKVFALLYDIAAELERRCDAAGLPFPISPESHSFTLVIEAVDGHEEGELMRLATSVLDDLGISFVTDPSKQRSFRR